VSNFSARISAGAQGSAYSINCSCRCCFPL
jgi:hypothetical protein